MIFSVILKVKSGDNLILWLDWFLRWYQLSLTSLCDPLAWASVVVSFSLHKTSFYRSYILHFIPVNIMQLLTAIFILYFQF